MDKKKINGNNNHLFKVAAFYCFTKLEENDILGIKEKLIQKGLEYNIKGTILIAREGFNGTVCGSPESIKFIVELLYSFVPKSVIEEKFSWCNQQAFRKLKVRSKKEIVTMGVAEINPNESVGKYVDPLGWNEFINDPNTLVIDTRNNYEIGIGSFKNTINPNTRNFREFPKWVDNNLRDLVKSKKSKRIGMFCTGGIRCEKATSYLLKKGFSDVYHLKGGILRYLEKIPRSESLWEGECFVFDQRVALDRSLEKADYQLCYACGMPLNSQDRALLSYIKGVQCYHCESLFSDNDRLRFAERQKHYDSQVKLSI